MKLKLAVKTLLAGVGVFVATLFFATPAQAAATAPTITITAGATTTNTYGSNPTVTVRVTDNTNNPDKQTMTVSSSSTLAAGATTYGTCVLAAVGTSTSISECTITWSATYARLPYSATAYTMYAVMPGVSGKFIQTPSPVITATINKAPITYAAPETVSAITYGAAAPTMTAVSTGFFGTDTFATNPTCAAKDAGGLTYGAGSDAGSYTITCTGGTVGANYVLNTATSTATNKLVVNKRSTVVTATSTSVTYGNTPSYAFTFSNKYSADELLTFAADGSSTTSVSCGSTYLAGTTLPGASVSITCSQLTAPTNYNISSFTAGTLTINKRQLTLVATSYNKTFGDAAEGSYSFTLGGTFYGSESYSVAPSCTSTYTDRTGVASSPVAITCSATVDTAKYSLSITNGSINIARKAMRIVANSFDVVYGDNAPAYNYSFEAGFGLLSGTTLDTVPNCTSTYSSSTSVSASPVAINCTGAVQNNYQITYVAGAVNIAQRPLTVTANNVSLQYGSTKPTFGFTPVGFLSGQTFTTAPTCNASYSVTTPSTLDASNNNSPISITCSGAVQANYAITYLPGELTVTRRSLTITANSPVVTYGDSVPTYTYLTPVGFQNGESFASLSGTIPSCTASYSSATHVADSGLPVNCSGASAGNNYAITYVAGSVTINRFTITITPNAQSLVYGDAVPNYGQTHTAFIDGTSFTAGPVCTSNYTVRSNVGNYAITCTASVSNDYQVAVTPVNVVVAKRDLQVTSNTVNLIYGAPVPTYTTTVSATGNNSVAGGFVNGESFSSLGAAPSCTSAYSVTTAALTSSLTITCSGNILANYNISYVNTGLVVVAKRDLTVTGVNVTVTYGATKPSFSYTATGWVNGDGFAVGSAPTCDATYTTSTPTTYTAGSDVNVPLAINCTGGTQANYNISRVAGELTVQRRTLSITATSYSVTYGDSIVSFGFNTPVGFQNSETFVSIGGSAPTCASDYTNRTHVAQSGIATTCTGGNAGNNYVIQLNAGSVTIAPYAISVVAQDKTVVYGSAAPTYTNTTGSLLAGDNWIVSPNCSAAAYSVTRSVGTTAITCSYQVSSDYNVTVTPATLTITKRDILITPVSQSLHYGDAVPTYTTLASATGNNSVVGGWVNGDTFTTAPTCSSTYTTTTNVADAVGGLTISCNAGSAVAANYNISYGTSTLLLAKRVITMIAYMYVGGVKVNSVNYGDAKPSIRADDYAAQNFVGSDRFTVTGTCFASGYTQSSLPGNYAIACVNFEVGANYTIKDQDIDLVVADAGNVVVRKKNIEVSAKYQQITYGDNPDYGSTNYNFTPFYSTETFLPGQTPVCTSPYSRYADIGQFVITCSGAQVDSTKYTISYVNNVIDVLPLALVVNAATPTPITYGQAAPTLTYNSVGFVNGDNFSTAPICTSSYAIGADARNYTITCAGGVRANYTFSYVAATLVVNKRQLTVTVANDTVVYGDSLPTFSPQTTGWYAGQQWNGVTPSCSSAGYDANASANTYAVVGDYVLTCSGGILPNTNYTVTYVPASLSVTPRAVTVTANSYTRTYGSAVPTYGFSTSGFMVANPWLTVNSVEQIPVCSSAYSDRTGVGAIDITCSVGNAGANYEVSYLKGTFTITKKDLTVTATSIAVTYGANPAYQYTEVGFIHGDTYAANPVCSYTSYMVTTGIGTYPITCTSATQANYRIVYVPGVLTVERRALSVTAKNLNVAYGTVSPAYDVIADSFVNGETFATAPICTSAYTPTTEVSSTEYVITCSGAVAPNYTITYVAGILKVTGRNVYITYNRTVQYGTSITDGYLPQITGVQNGDNWTEAPTCSSEYSNTNGVGSYTTHCVGGAINGNYFLNWPVGHITVIPRTLYIHADNLNLSYGTVKPSELTATPEGFQHGESFATAGFAIPKCVTNYTNLTNAGVVVPITCSGATVSGNYDLVYLPGAITVVKKDLQIKANAMTVIYGSTPLIRNCDGSLVMHCYNLAGFVNGDAFAADQLPVCTSGYTSRTSVAVYSIVCTSADLANYNEIYVNANLTVLPKRLTVAAVTQTVIYGDPMSNLTYTASGWVNADTFSTVPTCYTFYTDNTGVGTYKNYTYCKGGVASNYDIRYYTGSITVVPRTLSITAIKTPVTYGTTVSLFKFTANGFANSDSFIAEPVCTSVYGTVVRDNIGRITADNRIIGTYDIVCRDANAGANYLPKYTNNVVVVSAKQITITALDKVIEYGTSNPDFGYSHSDFAYSDTFSVTPRCSSTYRETSAVGPYVISCIGAEAANYSFVYLFGTVNVIPRQLVIRVKNFDRTYGDDAPVIDSTSYTVDNLVNGDTLTVAPSCSTIYNRYSNYSATGYSITCSGAEQPNYDIQYVSGKITTHRYQITITPQSNTITYGDPVPTYQWTVSSGLVNDDSYISAPNCTSSYAFKSDQGRYSIACTANAGNNYQFNLNDGLATLTVAKKALSVVPDNQSRIYGQATPTYTYQVFGFVTGDDFLPADRPVCRSDYSAIMPVQSFEIRCAGAYDFNYVIDQTAVATLTMSKRDVTVTGRGYTVTYGAATPVSNSSYTIDGLVNSDTLDVAPVCVSTFSSTSNVGEYAVVCSTASDHDYNVTFVDGKITVNPKHITVTALDRSVTYGAAADAPEYAGSASGQWMNGDGFVTAPSCSSSYVYKTAVGSYTITCSAAEVSENYVVDAYLPGTLTVNPRAVTFTPDNKTVTYGNSAPAYTLASVTGVLDGDSYGTVVCESPYTSSSDATTSTSRYQITCSGAQNSNYTFSYNVGHVLVNKRVLYVTGHSKDDTVYYGDAIPQFDYSTSVAVGGTTYDFVNGDSFDTAPVCHSEYIQGSNVGNYTITCTGGADKNYEIRNNPAAAFTVNQAGLIITYGASSGLSYGDQITYNLLYTTDVGWFDENALTVVPFCSASYSSTPAIGTTKYATVYQTWIANCQGNAAEVRAALPNYTVTFLTSKLGAFDILKRVIKVAPVSYTINAADPAPAYALNTDFNFVPGEGWITVPSCSSTYTVYSARGTYPITCSGGEVDNTKYVIGTQLAANITVKSTTKTLSALTVENTDALSATTLSLKHGLNAIQVRFTKGDAFQGVQVCSHLGSATDTCTTLADTITAPATVCANLADVDVATVCTITVIVTAESEASKVYSVAVTVEAPIQSGATQPSGTNYYYVNGNTATRDSDSAADSVKLSDKATTNTWSSSLKMTDSAGVAKPPSGTTPKFTVKTGYKAVFTLTGYLPGSYITAWIRLGDGTYKKLTATTSRVVNADGSLTVTFTLPTIVASTTNLGVIQINGYDKTTRAHRSVSYGVTLA